MPGAIWLTPPWVSGCWIALTLGALLERAPVQSLPGFRTGVVLALLVGFSALAAWLSGRPGSELHQPAIGYEWTLVPVAAWALADARQRSLSLRVLLVVAAVAVAVAVLQFTVGLGDRGLVRIDLYNGIRATLARGFSSLHLTFGFLCALGFLVFIQGREVLGLRTWEVVAGRILLLTGTVVSGSRASQVALAAGVIVICVVRGGRRAVLGVVGTVLACVLLVTGLYLSGDMRTARLLSGEDGRFPIWATSWDVAVAHPLVGVGGRKPFAIEQRKAFTVRYPDTKPEFPEGAPHAHNLYLAMAAEHGFPALAALLALLGAVAHFLWQRRATALPATALGLGVIAAGLAGGLFEPYPMQHVPGAAFFVMLGMACAMSRGINPECGVLSPESGAPTS